MALVVETGEGLANSESYISVADADARHTSLGNTAWAGTDAVKEAALRRATEYLTQRYRMRWKGFRPSGLQALDWPRWGVLVDTYYLDSEAVPTPVANATADLALISLSEELNPALERAVVREKVGPLETVFSEHSPQTQRRPAIDQMLSPYLQGGGTMARLERL